MNIITDVNIPRWYGLSWDAQSAAIVLSVHHDMVPLVEKCLTPDAPIVREMKEQFGFTSFDKDFGFDGTLMPMADGDGAWIKFSATLPVVFQLLDVPCSACNGSGEDSFFLDQKCGWCYGTRKDHLFDWLPAYALSASMNVLFYLLEYPEIQTTSDLFQLMTIRLATDHGMGMSALSGLYGIPVVRWLGSRQAPYAVPEMVLAMRQAYQRMLGRTELRHGDFRASVDSEGGWLNMSCPGDACGLNPDHGNFSVGKGRGYRFLPHNIDNPVQQLTLLTGLAALYNLVDQKLGL